MSPLIFNESIMILGYLSTDNKFWPLNFILTMTRQYIYKCSKKGHILNFYELHKHIMHKYKEQKSLFALGLREERFNRNWSFWSNLFHGIDDWML